MSDRTPFDAHKHQSAVDAKRDADHRRSVQRTYDHFQQYYDQRHDSKFNAHELFALAKSDALIKTFIDSWLHGHCSWEAALIGIIIAQKNVVNKLQEQTQIVLDRTISSILFSDTGSPASPPVSRTPDQP